MFRKRALANGGGLMRMSGATSGFVGSIDLARDFTEMSTRLHISGEGAVLTMFRMGELFGQNEAEKIMYRLCAQDEARHVAFGVMHLRFLSETAPERREEIEFYLDEAEAQIMSGVQNPAGTQAETSEALAILLGGGKEHYDEGHKKLLVIRRRQLKEYMQRVKTAGFGARFENGRSTIPQQQSEARDLERANASLRGMSYGDETVSRDGCARSNAGAVGGAHRRRRCSGPRSSGWACPPNGASASNRANTVCA